MNPHSFLEPHSRAIRLWHWTFALLTSAAIAVVLLASTVFRTRNTTPLVRQQLEQKGIAITSDQARAVAHEFNDQLWNIHRIIGFVLVFLLFSRWMIERSQPRTQRLNFRLQKAGAFRSTIRIEQLENRHYLTVKTIYLVFYGLFIAMALTGLVLAFDGLPQLQALHIPAKKIHSLLQYPIYTFIAIHLIGVLRADLGRHKGLVSGMIHGNKLG
jgi:cytochrome b561